MNRKKDSHPARKPARLRSLGLRISAPQERLALEHRPDRQFLLSRVQRTCELTRGCVRIDARGIERVARSVRVEFRVIENVIGLPANSQA